MDQRKKLHWGITNALFDFCLLAHVAVLHAAPIEPDEFARWVAAYAKPRSRPSLSAAIALDGLKFAFVPGIHNERRIGFFGLNRQALTEIGAPSGTLRTIYLSSMRDIDGNAD